MAMAINAGDDVKRGDLYFVNPYEIIIKEDLRGRRKPPTQQEIIDMAESMFTNGQRQPVEVRKIADKKIQLTLGFTRGAAARLIREGFDFVNPATDEKQHIHNPEFKLKVLVVDVNEQQALLNNIIENAHRNATTPIDDAYNQQKLRDQLGKTDAEITRLYRYTDATKVGRYRKLLSLSNDIQDMIGSGNMSVQAGIALLELPEDEQKLAIAAAVNEKGAVSGAAINDIVRDHHLRDMEKAPVLPVVEGVVLDATIPVVEQTQGGSTPTITAPKKKGKKAGEAPKKKTPARTMKHLRKWIADEERVDQGQKDFLKVFELWLKGQRNDKSLNDAFETLTDYSR